MTSNPHVLVTRGTEADHRPGSAAYMNHALHQQGLDLPADHPVRADRWPGRHRPLVARGR